MTFAEIKTQVRANLADAGVTFFSDQDLSDSLQDGYNEVAIQTGCIIKKASALPFIPNLNYYDFSKQVSDFIGILAIFNKSSNLWLLDDTSLKDMDKIRENWELWTGTPRWWMSLNLQYICIVPKYVAAGNTFDLYYSASAPVINDEDTPLIVNDMQDLLEFYATADMLEQSEEFTKATKYWMGDNNSEGFYQQMEEYKNRVQLMVKSDLLFKI